MRNVIALMNMTLDGYCDHTVGVVTDELHEYYNEQMRSIDTLLYGRVTYQLMEDAFPALVAAPSGYKAIDEFAILMDNMPKIVFSKTLKSVDWKSATLAKRSLDEEVLALKQQPGKSIAIGSPSLIAQLTQRGLIDEYRLCIHPIVIGNGLALFKNITHRVDLKLLKTKAFKSGVVMFCYERLNGTMA